MTGEQPTGGQRAVHPGQRTGDAGRADNNSAARLECERLTIPSQPKLIGASSVNLMT